MKSDIESRKWLDEYMSLKQINPENPFTVPPSYFDDLEQRITSYVHLNDITTGAEGLTVPANYFDDMATNIQSRIAIEEFVNAEHHGFAVPEAYFETLEANINTRVMVEEALNETEKSFTVPENYFEQLNKKILNQTVNQDMVMRKGIVRKLFAASSFKYAAAACFAVIIGVGVFVTQVSDPNAAHNNSFLHKQVSTIPVGDIQSYLQNDVEANDTQHAVIDQNAPVNDAKLNSALQDYTDSE